MRSKILTAGVVLAVAAAGAAYAAPHKAAHSDKGATVASPAQPVPYGMLDAYLKASPKARSAMLANASSSTMQSDASATAPAAPAAAGVSPAPTTDSAAAGPAASATTDAGMQQGGAVNPTPASPPPADSAAPAAAATDKH